MGTSLKLTQNKINELTSNWAKALPISFGNLFSYLYTDKSESEAGKTVEVTKIERYDTYRLNPKTIKEILKFCDKNDGTFHTEVETIAIKMGLEKGSDSDSVISLEPTNAIFQPILDIRLKNKDHFYYLLNPINEPFVFKKEKSISTPDQISPKVAELFIMKWQCLSDTQLVNAFEGIAPPVKSQGKDENSDELVVSFGQQKPKRVSEFIFDIEESEAIMKTLCPDYDSSAKETNLYLHLGAGLVIPDFHPFNFRPIIKIEKKLEDKVSATTQENSAAYFDTSLPCPPFCGWPPKG